MNRAASDNTLLAFGCRPIRRRTRRALEAAAWIAVYAAAIDALWYGATFARASGWL